MYNSLVRLQNTFGFFTTVIFVVGALIALSDLASVREPTAVVKANNIQVVRGRPHYYSSKKEEYAVIRFSLEADLSSLFTWNTKQVFVYVTAQWPSLSSDISTGHGTSNVSNQAVIWDSIITSPSADHLANIGPAALRKLRISSGGKSIDKSRGVLSIKNQKPKYQITHPSGTIAETDSVTLKLHYSVQPWVGLLTWNQDRDIGLWRKMKGGLSSRVKLPAIKKKEGEAKKA